MAALIPDVSRETHAQLSEYVSLLLKWNRSINLIAGSTEADVWQRHIADAQQSVPLVPKSCKSLLDMGSGAGLPGIVIAIMRADLSVTLLERDTRKAAFLLEAKARLGLNNVMVASETAERHQGSYDCITARALASLVKLCEYAAPLIHSQSICLFAKGENYAIELEEAQQHWEFSHHLSESATQAKAMIISITKLKNKA